MNLVTQTLLDQLGYHPISEFVRWWDPFEDAVIRVYKTGMVSEEDRQRLLASREELNPVYGRWQAALKPYWQDLLIEGKPVRSDPFHQLLTFDQPGSFLGNWKAMQTLPVAREAINRYLVEQVAKKV